MKLLWKIAKAILVIACLIILALYFTGNDYVFRGFQLTYLKGQKTANIDDYPDFDNNIIMAAAPRVWQEHPQYNQIPLTDTLQKELDDYQTAAFIVIKNNQLLSENYYNGYAQNSLTNSFSMAKSITTMLLGKAIEQGYIKGLDQKITDFLPEYKNDPYGKRCTIGDLSAMTSGYDWDEDYYFPINPTAKAYYGTEIEQQMLSRKFVRRPGGAFTYQSGDTQLLGIILKRALNGKSLSTYLQEEFWQPMGMELDAQWSKDQADGMEKTYCCFNSNARDFAKLGQLLLNKGHWYGKQILSPEFVETMITPNAKAFPNSKDHVYGYSIWTDSQHTTPFYAMLGHLGQRIIVVPSEDLVIVRLGSLKDERQPYRGILKNNDIYYYVDEVVKMTKNIESHVENNPL